MKNTNIDAIITEYKEYQRLQDELKEQMDVLKAEMIEYLDSNGADEYMSDAGKISYREVLSKRLDSTALKKKMPELYAAFQRQTSNMRFNCN